MSNANPKASGLDFLARSIREGRGPVLWVLGILVGLVAGYATIGLRLGISFFEQTAFGVTEENLASQAATLSYLRLILIPLATGIVIASLYYLGLRLGLMTEPYGKAVADVLEARAVKGGKVELRSGLYSALLSAISLGGGASAGREGPAVHLGGTMGSALAAWLASCSPAAPPPRSRPVSTPRSPVPCSPLRSCSAITPCARSRRSRSPASSAP